MTGPRNRKRRRRRGVKRAPAEHYEHVSQISVAVRLVMMIWEIIWALVREHILRGTGPQRLL
jgi:hypothetical protein